MNQISDQRRFVDSHVHLDITYRTNPDRVLWLRTVGCLPVSWAFAYKSESLSELQHYLELQKETIREIRNKGKECYFLAGIHPRNIFKDLRPEVVKELLLPSLEDDYCLGIGEIGLEKGAEHEKEIFLAQLDLAQEVVGRKKIFGIHTPRANKAFLTKETLTLIESYLPFRESIVVDHCTFDTIRPVLDAGLWAGITMSPIKTSFQDLGKIIHHHTASLGRIMLNTDSGGRFHDDLIRFYHSQQFDQEVKKQIANQSATRFFGL